MVETLTDEEFVKRAADAAMKIAQLYLIEVHADSKKDKIVLNLSDVIPILLCKGDVDIHILNFLEKEGRIKRTRIPKYDSFVVLEE